VIFRSYEDAAEHVGSVNLKGQPFDLAISDDCTFAGQPDLIGAGMALVLDVVLSRGYEPDGVTQRNGHRQYKYRLSA